MGMPLERARPGVQHGEGTDLTADELRVGAQRGESIEGGAKQHGQQRPLVRANDASELGRQREHDVKVGHRQHQLALSREPALRGVVSALRTRAVSARVIEQVLGVAARAVREVAAQRRGAAARDGAQGADMTGQHAPAVSAR